MIKILKYIVISIAFLFSGCHSASTRALYPLSATGPVYKVGQKYSSKVELSYHRNSLSKWYSFDVESIDRQKIPTGTVFEVVKMSKTFGGTFGRSLEVWVKFKVKAKEYSAFISDGGLGKKIYNVDGYNVYLVPDASRAKLLK